MQKGILVIALAFFVSAITVANDEPIEFNDYDLLIDVNNVGNGIKGWKHRYDTCVQESYAKKGE